MIIKLGKLEINTKKIGESVKKLVEGVKPEWKPRKIWNMWEHKGWGDSISWLDFEKQKLTGHIGEFGDKIREGDEVRCKMQSGRVARFKVVNLEYQSDPTDMFFANGSFEGYVEGADFDVEEEKKKHREGTDYAKSVQSGGLRASTFTSTHYLGPK